MADSVKLVSIVTPSTPTCNPATTFENRTALTLGDECGNFGNIGFCSSTKSACMPSETDTTWRCRCITGYVFRGGECTTVPKKLFREDKITFTVEKGASPGEVGRIDLNASLSTFTLKDLNAAFRPQTELFRIEKENAPQNLFKIFSQKETTESTTHILVVYATAVVGTSIGSATIIDVTELEIKVNQSAATNRIQTFYTHITDDTSENQVVYRIPTEQFQSGSLSITGSNLLRIDSTSGIVYTKKMFKSELLNDQIGKEMKVDITTVGSEIVAQLYVLIIKTEYSITVKEGRAPDKNIGIFSFISSNINISVSGIASEYFYANGLNLYRGNYYFDFDAGTSQREYTFNIIVNAPSYSTNTLKSKIIAQISDENDQSPKFVRSFYDIPLLLSALSNVLIGFVTAEDGDTVGAISYSIETRYQKYFTINELGAIRTRVPVIDLANITGFNTTTRSVNVNVIATDNSQSDTATFHIQITSPPEQNLEMTFTGDILEEAPHGTNITTVFVKGYTNYKFAQTVESQQYFRLNSTTGDVHSNKKFDRETESKKEFIVTATKEDEFSCSLTVLGKLVVTVLDINDNSPTFVLPSYDGSVMENMKNSSGEKTITMMTKITATDADAPENAKITYHLSNNFNGTFTIDATTGQIKTLVTVDREATSHFNLTVIATDGENNGTTFATIKILDENDNGPEFNSTSYSFGVPENIAIESSVGNMRAVDLDEGNNGQVIYDIVGGNGYFQIDRDTGIIKVKHALDRETVSSFTFKVVARDNGVSPRSSTANVEMKVTDINDNNPVISTASLQVSVDEDIDCSTSLHTVTAEDLDVGINKDIDYKLLSQVDKFLIHPTTGLITCNSGFKLDFETTTRHEISIQAKDKGTEPRSSDAKVVIQVKDVNDNDPEFSDDFEDGEYSMTLNSVILEGTSPKPLLVIPVNDKDSGVNGQITIEVSHGNFSSFIVVDSVSKLLSSKGSAKPAVGIYTAVLTAKDGGTSSRQKSLTITFIITTAAAIDNQVDFTQENIDLSIQEGNASLAYNNSAIPSFVSHKENKQMKYSIITPQNNFRMKETDGKLTVLQQLDREQKSEHFFVVRAENKIKPEDSDLALVKVKVTDVNDNSPRFSKEKYIYLVSEDENIGHTFTDVITATDADDETKTKLRYKQKSVKACADSFHIDENNGAVSVQTKLDYESFTFCSFEVEVTDSDTSPNTASVEVDINIQDINDNTPTFNEPADYIYVVIVQEDAKINDKITPSARVEDDDDRGNGDIRFEMKPDTSCLFDVEEGLTDDKSIPILKVKSSLDYETKTSSKCVVIAFDQPGEGENIRSSSATFSINILDVNDNPPVILNKPYKIDIRRDIEIGTSLLSINATDEDSGINAKLKYTLEGMLNGEYFRVNADNGSISIKNDLASFQKDTAELIIKVEDSGSPSLSSSTTVTVAIADANIRPEFNTYEESIELEEEHEIEGDIFKAQAFDRNGSAIIVCQCTYRIDYTDSFSINSSTGVVKVLPGKVLNREKTPRIVLIIIAKDDGEPPKDTKRLLLTIRVTDINDQAPIFRRNYVFDLLQIAPNQTYIGQVIAFDADEGFNAVTRYSVVNVSMPDQPSWNISTNLIKINKTTGQLFLNGILDRNSSNDFVVQVKVKAEDALDDQKYDYTEVQINVKVDNPNKNKPMCSNANIILGIRNATENFTIIKINGTDLDGGIDGEISYSISAGNFRDIFRIDESTGEIKVNYAINKALRTDSYPSSFQLTISLSDNGVSPLTGSCTVSIKLEGTPEGCIEDSEFTGVKNEKDIYLTTMVAMGIALLLFIVVTLVLTYMYCTTSRHKQSSNSDETDMYKPTFANYNKGDKLFSGGNFNPSSLEGDNQSVGNLSEILGYEEPSGGMTEGDLRRSAYTTKIVNTEPRPDYDEDDTSEEIDFDRLKRYAKREERPNDFKRGERPRPDYDEDDTSEEIDFDRIKREQQNDFKRGESSRKERHRQVYGNSDNLDRSRPEPHFQPNISKKVFQRDRNEYLPFSGSDWNIKRHSNT